MIISLIPNQKVQTIHCSQDDTLRDWKFQLVANDTLYRPTGFVTLICDQTEIQMLKLSSGEVTCGSVEISSIPGFHKCKIKLTDGDEILYSSLFYLHVEVKP